MCPPLSCHPQPKATPWQRFDGTVQPSNPGLSQQVGSSSNSIPSFHRNLRNGELVSTAVVSQPPPMVTHQLLPWARAEDLLCPWSSPRRAQRLLSGHCTPTALTPHFHIHDAAQLGLRDHSWTTEITAGPRGYSWTSGFTAGPQGSQLDHRDHSWTTGITTGPRPTGPRTPTWLGTLQPNKLLIIKAAWEQLELLTNDGVMELWRSAPFPVSSLEIPVWAVLKCNILVFRCERALQSQGHLEAGRGGISNHRESTQREQCWGDHIKHFHEMLQGRGKGNVQDSRCFGREKEAALSSSPPPDTKTFAVPSLARAAGTRPLLALSRAMSWDGRPLQTGGEHPTPTSPPQNCLKLSLCLC